MHARARMGKDGQKLKEVAAAGTSQLDRGVGPQSPKRPGRLCNKVLNIITILLRLSTGPSQQRGSAQPTTYYMAIVHVLSCVRTGADVSVWRGQLGLAVQAEQPAMSSHCTVIFYCCGFVTRSSTLCNRAVGWGRLIVGVRGALTIKMDGCIIAPKSGCLPATTTITTTTTLLMITTTSMTTNSCMHSCNRPVDNE